MRQKNALSSHRGVCRHRNAPNPVASDCTWWLACPRLALSPSILVAFAWPQIVLAAKERNPQSLGEAVEALNISGEGVLHRACAKKQGEVAQLLLEVPVPMLAVRGDTARLSLSRGSSTLRRCCSTSRGPTDLLNASNKRERCARARAHAWSSGPPVDLLMDPAQPLTSPYRPTATCLTLLCISPPLSHPSSPLSPLFPPPTDECTPPLFVSRPRAAGLSDIPPDTAPPGHVRELE